MSKTIYVIAGNDISRPYQLTNGEYGYLRAMIRRLKKGRAKRPLLHKGGKP